MAPKSLKRSAIDVMKTENDRRVYFFLSWLDNFVYKRSKCNLQNNEEEGMEASEPVKQYISEIDPDIFNDMDVQNRSSFIKNNSSSPVTLEPKTENVSIADMPSLFFKHWAAEVGEK